MLENKSPDFRVKGYFNLDDKSLANYIRFAWADVEPNEPYIHNWHIDAISEHLEAVTSGQITKLIINMPPRFLKSTLMSVMWPTWEWTTKPWTKFLYSSYAGNLAVRDSIKCRLLIQSAWYQSLFGNRFKLITELQEKLQNDKNGYRLAASVGGSATGEGGDRVVCLDYDTIIHTNCGMYKIGDIVNNSLNVMIYSYNHNTDKIELKKIKKYYQNNAARSFKVKLSNGTIIKATGNHPFFVIGRGYIQAAHLKKNDEVIVYDQKLSSLQQGNKQAARTFCKSKKGYLLQSQVLWGMAKGQKQFTVSRWNENCCVPKLSERISSKTFNAKTQISVKVLFETVPFGILQKNKVAENNSEDSSQMFRLRESNFNSQTRFWQEKVLFPRLCKQSAQSLYQRNKEWPIFTWDGTRTISSRIQSDDSNNQESRFESVLSLQKNQRTEQERIRCSSYRLQQTQQQSRELNNFMPNLSRLNAWEFTESQEVDRVFVESVTESDWLDTTYNLEVEGNNNYFANGVLVHNCDDPHKIEEIESDTVRQGVLDWWDQTMNTRLNNPKLSARVITMQRLHEEDLVGHLLASNQGYVHLCLPMEYEGQKYFTPIFWRNPFTGVKEKYGDPRTKEGELLFPKRYGPKEVQSLKTELLDYGYASKYQQHPIPKGGAMFHRNWFKLEKASPIEIKKSVRYWDKAGTAGGGAYTVGVRMVILPNNLVIIEDVVRAQVADLEREEMIKQTAQMDRFQRPNTQIWIEQEPGSGGKDAAAATIRNLAGFPVYTERPTGDKMTRASPLAAYAKAGNVYYLEADWNDAFLREFEFFPRGKYKDQVDASSGAFNKLFTGGFAYNVGG